MLSALFNPKTQACALSVLPERPPTFSALQAEEAACLIDHLRITCGSPPPMITAQAEISAENAYTWSGGKVIYGSGTAFAPTVLNGKTFTPGQV